MSHDPDLTRVLISLSEVELELRYQREVLERLGLPKPGFTEVGASEGASEGAEESSLTRQKINRNLAELERVQNRHTHDMTIGHAERIIALEEKVNRIDDLLRKFAKHMNVNLHTL